MKIKLLILLIAFTLAHRLPAQAGCEGEAAILMDMVDESHATFFISIVAKCTGKPTVEFRSRQGAFSKDTPKEELNVLLNSMAADVIKQLEEVGITTTPEKLIEHCKILKKKQDATLKVTYVSPIQPTRPPEGDSGDEE